MKDHTLTKRDIEKLKEIRKSIFEGNACTYDKIKCLEYLDSVLEPKCVICRQKIEDNYVILNEKRMHKACRGRYRG